ncbi:MAG: dephospho-CoA kinase [Paramuribaculum sp.]|nr:dephospho-CoA kinase [Paramuribaculum sp.]
MRLVAITGGIGSGKSVVAKILLAMGYPVYDCDSRAKGIMDGSKEIKDFISENICTGAIRSDGSIDRQVLAETVFGCPEKLEALNSVVHDAVRRDLSEWCVGKEIAFVETAILYQSGLDRMADAVWEVVAPKEIRIERVMSRSNLTARQVEDRIKSQDSFVVENSHPATMLIDNDGFIPVLPRVLELLELLKK